jgi:hypothetical protein
MYAATPSAPAPAPPTAPSPANAPSWDQAAFIQAMNNFAAQGNAGTTWIFDSGSSSHMSSSNNMMSHCTPSYVSSITLGDGSSTPISCVGHTQISPTTKPPTSS